jgi:hypothetical protein
MSESYSLPLLILGLCGVAFLFWDIMGRPGMRSKSLGDAQALFNSAIDPACNSIKSILNSMHRGISRHPNPAIARFIQIYQVAANEFPAYGKLLRAIHRIDRVNETELQNRVHWFWSEYRLKRSLILDHIETVKESGIDVPSMPQFRHCYQNNE